MGFVKDSSFYHDAIQILEYPWGDYYMFSTYIISEIKEGVVYTWDDHAAPVVKELSELYDQKGENLVLIANRVHSYSVKPSDWIKFFKSDYKLKGYAIVTYSRKGFITSLIEKLFMRSTFQSFDNLEEAIAWAKEITNTSESKSNGKSA